MSSRPCLSVVVASLLLGIFAGCAPSAVTFYFGDVERKLKEAVVDRAPESPAPAARLGPPEAALPPVLSGGGSGKVLLIEVRGLIIDSPTPGLLASGRNPVAELAARLRKAETDPEVKAVLLRVVSPGGGVGATETMYDEVLRFRRRTGRPVVVQLGDVAASGGYYLALAGDVIVAQPSGITGSIGVIIPTVNVAEGMARIGVRARSIKSGMNKDLANPLEPMREHQYEVLQALVDDFYARFRQRVLERRAPLPDGTIPQAAVMRRGIDESRLDALTDGRVLSGLKAVEAGLADLAGGLETSFEAARRLAGLRTATLVTYYRGLEKPVSPYASAESPAPAAPAGAAAPAGGTEINLLQVRLDSALQSGAGAGAYYLWLPSEF